MLDAWDDDTKKYREASGSGGLHTKERCEEMKAKYSSTDRKKKTTTATRTLEAEARRLSGYLYEKMQDDEAKAEGLCKSHPRDQN